MFYRTHHTERIASSIIKARACDACRTTSFRAHSHYHCTEEQLQFCLDHFEWQWMHDLCCYTASDEIGKYFNYRPLQPLFELLYRIYHHDRILFERLLSTFVSTEAHNILFRLPSPFQDEIHRYLILHRVILEPTHHFSLRETGFNVCNIFIETLAEVRNIERSHQLHWFHLLTKYYTSMNGAEKYRITEFTQGLPESEISLVYRAAFCLLASKEWLILLSTLITEADNESVTQFDADNMFIIAGYCEEKMISALELNDLLDELQTETFGWGKLREYLT